MREKMWRGRKQREVGIGGTAPTLVPLRSPTSLTSCPSYTYSPPSFDADRDGGAGRRGAGRLDAGSDAGMERGEAGSSVAGRDAGSGVTMPKLMTSPGTLVSPLANSPSVGMIHFRASVRIVALPAQPSFTYAFANFGADLSNTV